MALESKPLFCPEVLRQQVRSFYLPEQTAAWQPKLEHGAGLITSGRADQFKETALIPDFLTDIFCGLLGYTGPAEAADTFTLSRERHVEVDGRFADAVPGRTGWLVNTTRSPCVGGKSINLRQFASHPLCQPAIVDALRTAV
jgi:hypothetical protein